MCQQEVACRELGSQNQVITDLKKFSFAPALQVLTQQWNESSSPTQIPLYFYNTQKTYPPELNNYRPVALNSIIMLEESGQENHTPSCLTAPGVTSNLNTSKGGDTDGLSPALSASTLRHRRKLHSTPLHQLQPQFQHYPTASCHQKATTPPSFITTNPLDPSLPFQQATSSKS